MQLAPGAFSALRWLLNPLAFPIVQEGLVSKNRLLSGSSEWNGIPDNLPALK